MILFCYFLKVSSVPNVIRSFQKKYWHWDYQRNYINRTRLHARKKETPWGSHLRITLQLVTQPIFHITNVLPMCADPVGLKASIRNGHISPCDKLGCHILCGEIILLTEQICRITLWIMMLLITNQARNQSDQKPKNPEMRASNKSATRWTGRRETKTLESRAGDNEKKHKKVSAEWTSISSRVSLPTREEIEQSQGRSALHGISVRKAGARTTKAPTGGGEEEEEWRAAFGAEGSCLLGSGGGDGWVQKIVKGLC